MNDQDEKTEEPTAKRLSEARQKGQVAKSADLSAAIILLIAALLIYFMGGYMAQGLQAVMKECFMSIPTMDLNINIFIYFFKSAAKMMALILGPFFIIIAFIALLTNIFQVGFLFSMYPLKPNFGKIFGPEAFKKLFSADKLVELVKNILKMSVVGIVGYQVIASHYEEYLYLADQSIGLVVIFIVNVITELFIKCALLLLVIGILDLFYQKYKTKKGLKMTKQEVKDEAKMSDGDPQIKSKIRALRNEMHRKMMMDEVPKATVVVTNPTFIAIAIRYEQGETQSPIVVAKGKRLIAEKIKKLALENDIPIIEDKPLARSMFDLVQVGDAIPNDFFGPVAEILAYVYSMKNRDTQHAFA